MIEVGLLKKRKNLKKYIILTKNTLAAHKNVTFVGEPRILTNKKSFIKFDCTRKQKTKSSNLQNFFCSWLLATIFSSFYVMYYGFFKYACYLQKYHIKPYIIPWFSQCSKRQNNDNISKAKPGIKTTFCS